MTTRVIRLCASEAAIRVSSLYRFARSGMKLKAKLQLVAALMSAGGLYAQPFTLWVTESSPGGTPPYLKRESGNVRSYVFDGHSYDTSNFVQGPTIPASGLSDARDVTLGPSGAYRQWQLRQRLRSAPELGGEGNLVWKYSAGLAANPRLKASVNVQHFRVGQLTHDKEITVSPWPRFDGGSHRWQPHEAHPGRML